MSDANTYNSFCEVVHQFPVTEIQDLHVPGKQHYVEIISMVKTEKNPRLRLKLQGWWRDNRPAQWSVVDGVFMVATPPTGLELSMDRLECEVRPGSVSDIQTYVAAHAMMMPLRLRAFGKVIRKGPSYFDVEGQTYMPQGRKRFTVHFRTEDAEVSAAIAANVEVGSFAGGAGVVIDQASGGGLVSRLESLHVGVSGQATNTAQDQGAVWAAAFGGQDIPAANDSLVTKGDEVTALTSFCEATHRFVVADVRTMLLMGTDTKLHPVNVHWSGLSNLARKSVHRMVVNVAMEDQGTSYFVAKAVVRMGKAMTTVYVKVVVPESKRWRNLRELPVGAFITARGIFDSIASHPPNTIVVQLDHLSNPPPSNTTPLNGTGAAGPAETGEDLWASIFNGTFRQDSEGNTGLEQISDTAHAATAATMTHASHMHTTGASHAGFSPADPVGAADAMHVRGAADVPSDITPRSGGDEYAASGASTATSLRTDVAPTSSEQSSEEPSSSSSATFQHTSEPGGSLLSDALEDPADNVNASDPSSGVNGTGAQTTRAAGKRRAAVAMSKDDRPAKHPRAI
ncbi:hypothetical protein OC834_003577 [Tilletia horrida]|nr:hypothetical protein OC834_003577 [Tilletia horrida]